MACTFHLTNCIQLHWKLCGFKYTMPKFSENPRCCKYLCPFGLAVVPVTFWIFKSGPGLAFLCSKHALQNIESQVRVGILHFQQSLVHGNSVVIYKANWYHLKITQAQSLRHFILLFCFCFGGCSSFYVKTEKLRCILVFMELPNIIGSNTMNQ